LGNEDDGGVAMTVSKSVPIRAIFFDAVGTVIHPVPAAGDVYFETGQRFGSRLRREQVQRRFKAAFAAQEQVDAEQQGRTSEARELARWRAIVEQCLPDVVDREGCFQSLHEHFARPQAWEVERGAGKVLTDLAGRGFRLGLCSNFDYRLRQVLAGLPELRWFEFIVISSEVGWRKPAAEFFAAVARSAQLEPRQIVVIGDDRANDYVGARRAGMQALLFDPSENQRQAGDECVGSLQDLFALFK
jgi:putative hydrolase of the HAD superfamily